MRIARPITIIRTRQDSLKNDEWFLWGLDNARCLALFSARRRVTGRMRDETAVRAACIEQGLDDLDTLDVCVARGRAPCEAWNAIQMMIHCLSHRPIHLAIHDISGTEDTRLAVTANLLPEGRRRPGVSVYSLGEGRVAADRRRLIADYTAAVGGDQAVYEAALERLNGFLLSNLIVTGERGVSRE